MTVSEALQAVMTQSKHDHVWRHDTQSWNPIVHCQVGYRGAITCVKAYCKKHITMLWDFLKNIGQGLQIPYISCTKIV